MKHIWAFLKSSLHLDNNAQADHLSRSSEEFTGHAVNSSQNKALRGVCEKYLLIAGSVTRIPRERS